MGARSGDPQDGAAHAAAVAYGLFEIAILISVVTLATLLLLRPLQRHLGTADKTEDDGD